MPSPTTQIVVILKVYQ